MSQPTVFEFAGGGLAFLSLAAAHHERCLQDPVLNHPFSHHTDPQHVERLATYWAEVFGGPATYSQSYGGHSAMLRMHAGQGMEDDLGIRFVNCFVQAANDAELPEDAAFRTTLREYMEWAMAEVMTYDPADSQVPPELPIPHWSWDGLQTIHDTDAVKACHIDS